MQEPGIGEGASLIPIKDKVQAAKKAWQENNRIPVMETLSTMSGELSQLIEHGESSNDPLAYSLTSVFTRRLGGRYGGDSLRYLLKPPANTESGRKIKMVYVTQEEEPLLSSLVLLDRSSRMDPNHEFAEEDARKTSLVNGEKNRSDFLDDIERVYNDIAAHGIRKNLADFTTFHRGDPLSPKFDQHVKSLPFTGKLKFSPEPQKPEPPMPTIQKNQQPILEPQKPQEPTDYASLVQKAKAAREAAILARNNWEGSNRIEYLEGIAKEAERIAEERKRFEEEQESKSKVNEYLSKPGVKDVLRRFSDKFNQEAGKKFIYGITPDGLVVAVRFGCSENESGDDYFKAWVLDAKLAPDEMENTMTATSFHEGNVGSMGGNYYFPQFSEIFPASNTQLAEFYKKTGGFQANYYSFYGESLKTPTFYIGGGRTLYPLDPE